MNNAAPSAVTAWLVIGLFSLPALAQDLLIVRPRQEIISRGLEPGLKEKLSRGRFVLFHIGAPGTKRPVYEPYQAFIVYPYSHPRQRQSNFTGRDASGSLYFGGYPVVSAGSISVKVEPSDAEVLIDGYALKVDTNSGFSEKVGYPVGQHKLEARKSGFKPYAGEVEIKQASEIHLDIKLTP
jgi:hypothetical protein